MGRQRITRILGVGAVAALLAAGAAFGADALTTNPPRPLDPALSNDSSRVLSPLAAGATETAEPTEAPEDHTTGGTAPTAEPTEAHHTTDTAAGATETADPTEAPEDHTTGGTAPTGPSGQDPGSGGHDGGQDGGHDGGSGDEGG